MASVCAALLTLPSPMLVGVTEIMPDAFMTLVPSGMTPPNTVEVAGANCGTLITFPLYVAG